MRTSVKNEMIEIINDLHWKLEQAELDMRNKIKELEERNIETKNFAVDNRAEWFRSIVSYMSNGLTYQQSIQLLCDENHFDQFEMMKILKSCDYQRKATEMYAKIYMVKTLKKADFTNQKIADIMGISATTVAKLLKCNVVI